MSIKTASNIDIPLLNLYKPELVVSEMCVYDVKKRVYRLHQRAEPLAKCCP